jgi:hypothetical protein
MVSSYTLTMALFLDHEFLHPICSSITCTCFAADNRIYFLFGTCRGANVLAEPSRKARKKPREGVLTFGPLSASYRTSSSAPICVYDLIMADTNPLTSAMDVDEAAIDEGLYSRQLCA